MCAAMLMARTSFHFLSLANTKTLAASKTSTKTALDVSTEGLDDTSHLSRVAEKV
jgi:hypothetical protein